jgi:hypothetical protein
VSADPDAGDTPGEDRTTWEGYSDYREISLRTAESIDRALEAYALVDSAHTENASLGPFEAAEARSDILACAIKLIPELRNDEDDVDLYADVLERWTDGEGDEEDGYVSRLDDVSLRRECPSWLFQFVLDMRAAGWHLGYLQAGRTETEHADPVENEARSMFEGI